MKIHHPAQAVFHAEFVLLPMGEDKHVSSGTKIEEALKPTETEWMKLVPHSTACRKYERLRGRPLFDMDRSEVVHLRCILFVSVKASANEPPRP
ncbi:hypothetical protein PM082_002815 [Marasmius tenuissimus]|nr:hypothetical protein PM082_002815 [Marasmius tenuissimus]